MNPPSLLPPRGIFVPNQLIFHPQLPASVLVTWIQLRCLAWQGWDTPPYTLAELASLARIHPNRLHKHLSQLRDISALTWRTGKSGKLVITFPQEPSHRPQPSAEAAALPIHSIPPTPEAPATALAFYFPARILGYLSYDDEDDERLTPDELVGIEIHPRRAERQQARQMHSICTSDH